MSVTWNGIFLIFASIITLKAHEPLDTLLKVDVTCISDQAYKSITMFVNRLNGKTIGFRMYEMFTLDASAILMLIGTLVTYAVVMLQFTSVPTTQQNLMLNQTNCTCC
ncbi:hypothetical protein LOTGIDRAFT_164512 [Lottia gigantea]|uniref:Uncharacterized protein n=1 Tax=Lottia gigantea TaxID=225164 RepID=V4A0J9_LOTGI|nr:hypothetical protein LOTGIDRAFT_164512 [Lottia gigantea]ESO90197.1 hypothetical protein LOTGIDRAFT_164512 [Lottia gigantea]